MRINKFKIKSYKKERIAGELETNSLYGDLNVWLYIFEAGRILTEMNQTTKLNTYSKYSLAQITQFYRIG